eukprot:99106-Chlamydomonas_euryale.AAC.1
MEFESHLLGTAKQLWDAVTAYFLSARNGADQRELMDICMLERESVLGREVPARSRGARSCMQ